MDAQYGHEFEQAPGVGDGQGSLVFCHPWVTKSQTWLSFWTELEGKKCVNSKQIQKDIDMLWDCRSEFLLARDWPCCLSQSYEWKMNRKKITWMLTLGYSADNLPEGTLDVLIPQTVDEGVQHRGDHSVHHWGHCALPGGRQGSWAEIHTKACSIK